MIRPEKLLPLLPIFVFGIPFLLITDLFPLHRFGMFARIPGKKQGMNVEVIQFREGKKLQVLTGNHCLDKGILASLSAAAWTVPQKAEELTGRLLPSLHPVPDSIFLCSPKPSDQCKRIYPAR